MATIRVVDLAVRTIIGTHPWERVNKQDLLINMAIEYDASKASKTDQLKDALNYEAVTNQVIKVVENSKYLLLEKLTAKVLALIMSNAKVQAVWIRIDKPHAIAQAACVSFELSDFRQIP